MQRGLVLGLDHLVWAASSLDAGNTVFFNATGIEPQAGGSHEGFGTHNALVGLDGGRYFEIIAPDPGQDGGPLADAVGRPDSPHLIAWAARVADADAVTAAAAALGLAPRIVPMERVAPEGGVKRWKVVVLGGHPHRGAVPFFIDWMDTPHPSEVLAGSARLEAFSVMSPVADALRILLTDLGVEVEIHQGPEARLSAVVIGPAGPLTAAGPASGLMDPLR